MELPIVSSTKLEDGKYNGVITRIEYTEEPHKYTDVYISVAENQEIKAGYPTIVTESSLLGALLNRFGAMLQPGKSIDPDTILIGKKVTFMAVNKKSKDGKEYTEILRDTVKPIMPTEEKIE